MYTAAEKEALNEKGSNIAADLSEGTRRVKSDIRGTVHAVRDDIEDMARQAGRQVRDFASSAEEKVAAATETVTVQIRENPVQSTLIALGVGFFLGFLFRRT
jgi:ElaB/YqjD/DUF883 family membrane-anchored ribosome-binding protein